MISAQQQATLTGSNCDIAFDNLTRQLYATDASIYQIEPIGVAHVSQLRDGAQKSTGPANELGILGIYEADRRGGHAAATLLSVRTSGSKM